MPKISKKFLNNLTQKNIIKESFDANEPNRIDDGTKQYQIFFSYCYSDKEYAIKMVSLLEKSGFSVYIDLKDPELSRAKETDKQTIERISKIMNRCKSLIYLHTASSKTSKWCPWELGYVSGKTNFRCATILLVDDEEEFPRQEYLEIYPYLDYVFFPEKGKYLFFVNDLDNDLKFVSLYGFIENGLNPYLHI